MSNRDKSAPLNLCFVADASNIHAQRWMTALVNRGHQVTCLADKGGQVEGVNVIALPNRDDLERQGKKTNKTTVLKARASEIKRVVTELKPDVVHAIFLYQRGWSAALANCHPLVVTLLGSDIFLPEQHYRSKLHHLRDVALNRGALYQADLATAVNQNLANEAQALCENKLNMLLTPIGTDNSLFNAKINVAKLTKTKAELSIDDDAVVILSPRQITPLYNIDVIIEAFSKMLAQCPKAILLLKDTACNTDERRQYKAQLQTQVNELGLQTLVRWVNEVAYGDLPTYFHLADMVVSIPKTDGLPVTLFDAMACGVACITGDLPSYDGIITDGETGLRVKQNDANSLASAMAKLANNQGLRETIVVNSQQVLQQYGIFENTIEAIEKTYYALVKAPQKHNSRFSQLLYNMLIKFS